MFAGQQSNPRLWAGAMQLKWLGVIDQYTRENLSLEVEHTMTSEDVIDQLANFLAARGIPKQIHSDNDPEFIAQSIQDWLCQLEVETPDIEPDSPWENAYSESLNRRFRDEFLTLEIFDNLTGAKRLTACYRRNYNEDRRHSSLGHQTPVEFARQVLTNPYSYNTW